MAALHAVRVSRTRWGVAETPGGQCLDVPLPGTISYTVGSFSRETIHAPNVARFFRTRRELAEAIAPYGHTLASSKKPEKSSPGLLTP